VLITDNAAAETKLLHGHRTMLELERTQFPVHPRRSSPAASGHRARSFIGTRRCKSMVWALLRTGWNEATLRRCWCKTSAADRSLISPTNNGFDAEVHDKNHRLRFQRLHNFKTALDYLRIAGDLAFLDEKLENGKTVLQRMDEMATDWKTLVLPDSPLANYGENGNLLECAPAYIHRVASCNAQNVWMMRQAPRFRN